MGAVQFRGTHATNKARHAHPDLRLRPLPLLQQAFHQDEAKQGILLGASPESLQPRRYGTGTAANEVAQVDRQGSNEAARRVARKYSTDAPRRIAERPGSASQCGPLIGRRRRFIKTNSRLI